ncbi:MAG: hypothetical protein LBV12_12270 [Puniceicoccales bacterium]|jgi:hypothetical protein|nr:hypothetical protein [Puniceicoccales bacterium]
MGYQLYITRRKSRLDTGNDISRDEFIAYVSGDPEFKYPSEVGEDYAEWNSPVTDYESWLCWDDGCIHTKNPSPEFIDKMTVLAKKLDARVQGDDLEIYESSTQITPSTNSNDSLNASRPFFVLKKSRLSIDGENLIRRNKDETIVASFELSNIEKAEIRKGIEPISVGILLASIVLAWVCFYFIPHPIWRWTSIAFVFLAILSLLAIQKSTLFIQTKQGGVEFLLYDQPEDTNAFAVVLTLMINARKTSPK